MRNRFVRLGDRDRINRAVKRDIARALISNPFTLIPRGGARKRRRGRWDRERRRDAVTRVIDQQPGQEERVRERGGKGEGAERGGESSTTQPVTRGEPGHFENHRVALP